MIVKSGAERPVAAQSASQSESVRSHLAALCARALQLFRDDGGNAVVPGGRDVNRRNLCSSRCKVRNFVGGALRKRNYWIAMVTMLAAMPSTLSTIGATPLLRKVGLMTRFT